MAKKSPLSSGYDTKKDSRPCNFELHQFMRENELVNEDIAGLLSCSVFTVSSWLTRGEGFRRIPDLKMEFLIMKLDNKKKAG